MYKCYKMVRKITIIFVDLHITYLAKQCKMRLKPCLFAYFQPHFFCLCQSGKLKRIMPDSGQIKAFRKILKELTVH